jgi:hypothetical protein
MTSVQAAPSAQHPGAAPMPAGATKQQAEEVFKVGQNHRRLKAYAPDSYSRRLPSLTRPEIVSRGRFQVLTWARRN